MAPPNTTTPLDPFARWVSVPTAQEAAFSPPRGLCAAGAETRRAKWRCIANAARGTALLVITVGLLAQAARADFDPEAWSTFRDIKAPEGAAGQNARVALDHHVWDQTSGPGLQDLRIIRDETDDVGFAVYVPEEPAVQIEQRPARVFNIARRGSEASELTVDLGRSPPLVNGLTLETEARNFLCGVTIEGSNDGETWKVLRDNGAIFAFSGDAQKRFTTVAFPDTQMRYVRAVVAAPPGGQPIELTGATIRMEIGQAPDPLPRRVKHPVVSRTETQQDGETWFTLDLGAKHLPASAVEFVTPAQNFSRAVRIDVGDDPQTMAEAGRGLIFRFATDRYREERLEVEFSEAFGRLVRLRVTNGDDPPLPATNLVVTGRPRYVFFPFEKDRRYRLFYGNAEARPPQYDYTRVLPHIDRGAAVACRLGDPRQNPRYIPTKAAQPPNPWIVRNQWVLYVALGVAVAALVLVAIRALRRTPVADESGGD